MKYFAVNNFVVSVFLYVLNLLKMYVDVNIF